MAKGKKRVGLVPSPILTLVLMTTKTLNGKMTKMSSKMPFKMSSDLMKKWLKNGQKYATTELSVLEWWICASQKPST